MPHFAGENVRFPRRHVACNWLWLPSNTPPAPRLINLETQRMVEVIEVNDIEQLSQYRMLWSSVFPGTPNATFFHTFDWLDIYWRHFGRDQKLRVLIIFAAGAPVGILPLCVRREPHQLGKVRVLTYPLDNGSTSYGPIGPNPASTMMRPCNISVVRRVTGT